MRKIKYNNYKYGTTGEIKGQSNMCLGKYEQVKRCMNRWDRCRLSLSINRFHHLHDHRILNEVYNTGNKTENLVKYIFMALPMKPDAH